MTSFQLVASSVRTLELGSLGGVGGSASSCSERSAHGDARGQSAASAQRRCWVQQHASRRGIGGHRGDTGTAAAPLQLRAPPAPCRRRQRQARTAAQPAWRCCCVLNAPSSKLGTQRIGDRWPSGHRTLPPPFAKQAVLVHGPPPFEAQKPAPSPYQGGRLVKFALGSRHVRAGDRAWVLRRHRRSPPATGTCACPSRTG
jgi:hypothetical protein